MSEETRERLFGYQHAFDHPVTAIAVALIVVLLLLAPAATWLLRRTGKISPTAASDIFQRWRSWLMLSVLMLAPLLLGAFWTILAVAVLSLLCYREFARATGLFREKAISLIVVLGIGLVTFAVLDNYPRLFFACGAFTVGLIAIATIPQDRPKGYVQRTALGIMGFLLFGYCLGYVGYFANDVNYRPILLWLLLGTELNDVFAYCAGKAIGGPKAIPNTSPGKTIAGSAGALVLTTIFVAILGHFVFAGTAVDRLPHLIVLGMGISVLGQLGDLLISSVKRDVGVKDIGAIFPGMGGFLDRFDSLVLIPPAAFHYLSLILGPIGASQAERIVTGN